MAVAVGSGLITAVAFPPWDLRFLAWVGLAPLTFTIDDRPALNALSGLLAGFVFHAFLLSWLHRLAGPAFLALAMYLGAYWALFCFLIGMVPERYKIFTGMGIWILCEYIVSHLFTGFPWLPLGLSQYTSRRILPIAGIAGVHGISAILILANLALGRGLRRQSRMTGIMATLLILVVLINPAAVQRTLCSTHQIGRLETLIVQTNIASTRDRNPDEILSRHLKKTTRILADHHHADLVIWPESSYPSICDENSRALQHVRHLAKQFHCQILLGGLSATNGHLYNTAFLVTPTRRWTYQKTHLVPYGEFIPAGRLPPVRRLYTHLAGYTPRLSRGYSHSPLPVKTIPVGVLICFENIFTHIARATVRENAAILTVITNDSWFGQSPGPYQHFAHNQMRAAETGRYVVQAALTGISGIVSPNGVREVISNQAGTCIFVEGHLARSIPVISGTTPYVRYGDIPLLLLCIILVGVALCRR